MTDDIIMRFDGPISFLITRNGETVRMTASSIELEPYGYEGGECAVTLKITCGKRTLRIEDLDSVVMVSNVSDPKEIRLR